MQPTDRDLLGDYVTHRSDAAFQCLVERHLSTVYGVARRCAGPALAEDVTQAVFIVLARKAPHLQEVRALGAWLHRITRCAAGDALRRQQRRRRHERRAAVAADQAVAQAEPDAPDHSRRVDDALARLATGDREALILRFFQEASYAEMAIALEVTEEAARKRTRRALAKLKRLLARTAPAALMVPLWNAACRAAPPAGLSAGIAAQITGAAGLSGRAATLAKGTLAMMSQLNLKLAAVAGALAAAVLFLAPMTARHTSHPGEPVAATSIDAGIPVANSTAGPACPDPHMAQWLNLPGAQPLPAFFQLPQNDLAQHPWVKAPGYDRYNLLETQAPYALDLRTFFQAATPIIIPLRLPASQATDEVMCGTTLENPPAPPRLKPFEFNPPCLQPKPEIDWSLLHC